MTSMAYAKCIFLGRVEQADLVITCIEIKASECSFVREVLCFAIDGYRDESISEIIAKGS